MGFERLIEYTVTRRIFTLSAFAFFCILGVFAWNRLEIEAYPDISDIEVSVITQVNGLPAEEVELQVTLPMERALNTVPGVISKRSRTIFGLSIVRLTFHDNISIFLARQLVEEKFKDADIPPNAKPKLGPMTPSIGEVFRYVIEAPDNMSLTDLRELQDYVIRPRILQAEGVIDVVNFGGLVKQYQVIVNPIQLEKYNLSILSIADAIHANNENTGGNYIIVGASQMNIRGIGRITKLEDIGNIVVDNRHGVPILIKDIASVEIGVYPPNGVLGYIDKTRNREDDSGIEGIVLLRKFENPSNTIKNIRAKIEELNADLLQDGIRVEPFYDRTELVSLTIQTVKKTLLEGTIVVFTLLSLLLGSFRAAAISSLAIPFSLLFAFVCMDITDTPVNLLSLGAIDFGIIVDAAIVMVEGIFRHITKRDVGNKNLPQIVIFSATEVQKQIIFSVGIIILAMLPILTLQRVEGRMFAPMAWTLSFAILGSMLYAILIVPVLSSILFQYSSAKNENRIWMKIQNSYQDTLKKMIAIPRLILGVSFGFVFFVFSISPGLGTEFLPELDEGCVWIRVFLPSGISLEAAKTYPDMIRREIGKYEEVRGVLTQLGRNDEGTDPFGQNRIEVLVQLKQPYSNWKSNRSKQELVLEMKKSLELNLPGAAFSITQPIIDTTTENSTGASADLAIFITGKNLDELRQTAIQILGIVQDTDGNSEASIEQEGKQTQVVIRINKEEAARFGINVEDVNGILKTAIAGLPVSSLYEDEKKFDIVLRFTVESRNTPHSLERILIPTKSGLRIPLARVAHVGLEEGNTIICREDGKRQITVKTNIRGRDQGSFASEIKNRIETNVVFPPQIKFHIGGQFENLQRSQARLMYIVPLTLVLIYLTLLVFFQNNYMHALIVTANIPFAVIGGILGLYIRGMHFSISAGVGFVSLFGISVMSGVLLLSYLNQLKIDSKLPLFDLIIEGSVTQFRPRFLVMTIAIIGLLPAAFNTGIGSDVQRPLATVIVGGLLSSLVLTLFVSPLIYYLHERSVQQRKEASLLGDDIFMNLEL